MGHIILHRPPFAEGVDLSAYLSYQALHGVAIFSKIHANNPSSRATVSVLDFLL
jgi:hypothetical protein